MATVKIQQYDRQVSPMARGATPRMNELDVSSGIESIGQGIAAIGDAVERKRLDDDAVAINKIQSEAEVQWSDWMNQSQDTWKRGGKELPAQFFESFDKWQKETSPNFQTKDGKRIFEQRMQQFRSAMGKSAVGWQASTNEKLKLMDLGESRMNMEKVAAANPAMAEMLASRFKEDTDNMILSPDQRAAQQQAARSDVAFAAEIGLLEKGEDSWRPDDKRWSWGNLSFEQQNRLKGLYEQQKRDREADARNKKNAQEQAAASTAKDILGAKLQGYKVSPSADAQLAEITAAYKDKPWAVGVQEANKYADEARTMAQWPIQEQQKIAKESVASVQAAGPEGVGFATDRAKFINQRFQDNAKRIIDDGWGYYEDVYGPISEPLNQIEPLEDQIANRKEQSFVIKAATGINPGILKPAEAPMFAEMLMKAPPDEALQLINQMAAGDPETAKATFDQLGKVTPAFAVAGKMQATGSVLPDGRQVGGVMLTGYKAMESKAVKFKKVSDVDQAVSDNIGEMFANAPGEYETARDAVKWLLAGKAAAAGKFEYEPSEDDIEAAIREVINPVDYRGAKVSAPVGTDSEAFDEIMLPKITSAIAGSSLSDENKRLLNSRHRLIDSNGDGVYEIAWSSGVRVLDGGYPIKVYYK